MSMNASDGRRALDSMCQLSVHRSTHMTTISTQTETEIADAAGIAVTCLRADGTIFLAGNGGSFADALHIAGELAKSFERNRPLPDELRARLVETSGSTELADCLQKGLRVVVLGTNPVLTSAVDNDLHLRHLGFAQELCALGRPDDMLFAISTSGNSQNLINAAHTAHALHMRVITLTGPNPNALTKLADATIHSPGDTTADIQTNYVNSYHRFCQLIECAQP
jgi:D-sedoheptulose 7-phosphate isomerase